MEKIEIIKNIALCFCTGWITADIYSRIQDFRKQNKISSTNISDEKSKNELLNILIC